MEKKISVFSIAGIYIGTLIGAGFASGQEILQFFVFHGLWGIVGILMVTALFVFFGYVIMELAYELRAKSHLEVINKVAGRSLGRAIDGVITFFLFAGFIVMAAGGGAIFSEQFGMSPWLGSGLMILFSLITIFLGVAGIINSISFVVPILVFSVLVVCISTLFTETINLGDLRATTATLAVTGNWLISAFLYVSYNTVVAVAVLAPLGVLARNKTDLLKGAVLGGFSLGITALFIHLALLANMPQVAAYEVPMLFLAANLLPVFNFGYVIILLLGIYTTAVGSLFGFLTRTVGLDNPKVRLYASIVGVFALFASQFGFSTMVRIIYPLVGYAGLMLLATLAYGKVKQSFVYGLGLAMAKPLPKDDDEEKK